MKMKRLFAAFATIALVALAAPVASVATMSTAHATPGAVDKQGCHNKKKRHCHSASEITTSSRGFRYVPFGRG